MHLALLINAKSDIMKTIKWIFAAVLLPIFSVNLMAGSPNWELIAPKPEVHLKTDEAASFKQGSYTYGNQGDNRCREYKRREIAGFVLLPVGIGAIIGGSFMVYRGVSDIHNSNGTINGNNPETPSVPKHDIVLISAGAAVGIIGLVLAPVGLSMGIGGAVRFRKYCGKAQTFYIAPSTEGFGLACRF